MLFCSTPIFLSENCFKTCKIALIKWKLNSVLDISVIYLSYFVEVVNDSENKSKNALNLKHKIVNFRRYL